MNKFVGLILLANQLAVTSILIGAEISPPQHLRCEFLNDPLGIDCPTPRLSWWLDDGRRGAIQTAYRILVASSPESLEKDVADLWDSGEVKSDQSHLVAYAGKPLTPHLDCSWKVRIWDQDGKPSAWSKPARWSMGPMGDEGWAKAKWIRLPADVTTSTIKVSVRSGFKLTSDRPEDQIMPVFRRQFRITRPLRRAMLYVCGLGHHEILLDGQRVSDDLLDPPWTQYDKTIGYRTHDVTTALAVGNHVLGIMLGNGRYNTYGGKDRYVLWRQCFGQPQLIMQLRLEYADGSIDTVVSDNQWRATRGPVLFTCAYGGEDQDLGRLPENWAKTDYDDAKWDPVSISNGPGGKLQWISQEPIRATEKFAPKKMTQNKDGVTIDFGQNCNLMPVLRLSGSAGKTISINTSESSEGKSKFVWYNCTLAGGGEEVFRPRFLSYGSRSIFVTGASLDGADGKVKILGAEGWSLRCSADVVGAFECSDPRVNKIDRLIYWSMQSNFQSILTDCPQREKQGWLEVSHLMAPSILFRLGAANFYRKIQNDMVDMQNPKDGFIPTIAPFAPGDPRTGMPLALDGFRNSPEWSSAFVINPGMVWQWTGDRTLIEKYYESMKCYVAYLTGRSKNGILAYGLGDWASREREKTPKPIVATAIFYQDLSLMTRYAQMLGKDADATAYAAQAAAVKQAFANFWKDEATGYGEGSQAAQAMPLFLGMVEESRRPAALARLIADAKAKGSTTGGDISNRYIFNTLAQAGQSELVFASTVSGKGYYMGQTGTTLATDSKNHLMCGDILEWLHGYLVGIRPDPDSPGFKHFLLEPNPVGNLTWAKGHHDGSYGRISLHWRRQDGKLLVDITVPPNSSATLRLPTTDPNAVREQDKPLSQAAGISSVNNTPNHITLTLAAGVYQFNAPFTSSLAPQPAEKTK